ncbi:MAG: hypothetical protein NZV14_03630 [Bryobacteraceae bacterium]|nr:hypothetical protein [Bryobacteraceae bacterium]MDW8377227.1 hypothetical protein [Bryobacterales bacterium]
MFSKLVFLSFAVASVTLAQLRLDSRSSMNISLPEDAPIAVVAADWGGSSATPRGSAMLLDLRTSLTLRNVGAKRIRGVTLLVQAQEVAPGGKASVSVPSLDVGPGEAFPIKLDLRLLRPQPNTDGPLVEITLDGVLFDDLSFYGANRLNSRRSMTQWELEARRDRRYLKQLYETAGAETLQQHLKDVQARLSERMKVDVQVARGRTTNQEPRRSLSFAFLQMADEPVRASGSALVAPGEAHAPQLVLENISNRPIRYLEVGWIFANDQGEEIYAGTLPAEVNLGPRESTRVRQEASLKLTQRNGKPVSIAGLSAFLSHVEFADGTVWIPQRAVLEESRLRKVLNPSPEEQRLAELYRRKGLQAVIDELRKF